LDTWREAVEIPKLDGRSKTCGFCSKQNPLTNNFCGNCGTDIKDAATDLTPAEVVDITTRMSQPPVPIQILADSNGIYICQVLNEDMNGKWAEFKRPAGNFQWKKIKELIEGYVMRINLSSPSSRNHPAHQVGIFAFVEKKGGK
jgi:hypothetical protein